MEPKTAPCINLSSAHGAFADLFRTLDTHSGMTTRIKVDFCTLLLTCNTILYDAPLTQF